MATKKLYRSRSNRVFGGVCGGLAEYLNLSPGILRVIAFILILPGFLPGLLPYIILWIVLPLESTQKVPDRDSVIDV